MHAAIILKGLECAYTAQTCNICMQLIVNILYGGHDSAKYDKS